MTHDNEEPSAASAGSLASAGFMEYVFVPVVSSIVVGIVFSMLWPCINCKPTLTAQEREGIRRAIDGWRANDAARKWSDPLQGLLDRTK